MAAAGTNALPTTPTWDAHTSAGETTASSSEWTPAGRLGAWLEKLGVRPVLQTWSVSTAGGTHDTDPVTVQIDADEDVLERIIENLHGPIDTVYYDGDLPSNLAAFEQGHASQTGYGTLYVQRSAPLVQRMWNSLEDRRVYATVMLFVALLNLTTVILAVAHLCPRRSQEPEEADAEAAVPVDEKRIML